MSRTNHHCRLFAKITLSWLACSSLANAQAINGNTDLTNAVNGMSSSVQQQGGILQQIATYTNGILTAVTSTSNPVVANILTALTNITAADNSTNPASPTPTMQSGFSTYIAATTTSATKQLSLQQTILNPLFGNFTTSSVPSANDLLFSSIYAGTPLAQPPIFNPDPRPTQSSGPINSGLNYVQLAAGLNIQHPIPNYPSKWAGSYSSIANYIAYFNTITAVETFDTYVLTQLYEDAQQGVPAAQTALITQASDPANWFAIIASESVGAVLRQILMYQSQTYVVLTQLLQTEKLTLAAQAVNTTMLMLSAQTNEALMVTKATMPPVH